MQIRFPSTGRTSAPLGGSSIEYITILALVVIPMALLTPMLVNMVVVYSHRMGWVIRSPFG